MVLVLFDITFKMHYNPYESIVGGALEKHNDLYVLFGAYALFYFTDYAPDPDTKEMFAWIFIGSFCAMAATNIAVLMFMGIRD